MSCITRLLREKKWAILIAWQVCSLFLCSSATMCNIIVKRFGMTIPLLMLSIAYTILLLLSLWRAPKSESSWWRYFLISAMILAGDYTAVYSYNTTSMASAMLLITTVIFWVPPFAYFLFGRKINLIQFFSILLSMTGSALVFIADGNKGSKLLGNMLALVSAFSYAVANVLQEYVMHQDSIHLYLFRFSIGASPLAMIACGTFEWKIIRDYEWNVTSIGLTVLYGLIISGFEFSIPFVMQFSDATTMNISMLTANFFSLAISIAFFGQRASWLYLAGFCCIPAAIVIFSLCGIKEKVVEIDGKKDENTNLLTESTFTSMTDGKETLD